MPPMTQAPRTNTTPGAGAPGVTARHRPARHRRVALFDLDGVLWHSNRVHATAFDEVAALNGLTPLDYQGLAGLSTEAAWRAILAFNGVRASAAVLAQLCEAKQLLARERLRVSPPLADGVELLAALPAGGVEIGLVTGSSAGTVAVFLDALAQPGRFTTVVSAESGGRGKPSPDPYLIAASQLGVAAQHCWVLEDSDSGLESATAAGAQVVHLSTDPCGQNHRHEVRGCVGDVRSFIRMMTLQDAA